MNSDNGKILPRITADNRRFWDSLRRKKFITSQCENCSTISFPPRLICPSCMSDKREWVELGGRGKIYAFTLNRIVPRSCIKEAPYITAMVDLEEGPRILTRIENADYEKLEIGQTVKVGFKPLTEEITFFFFEPVKTK